jgi:hypothetical protein
LLFIGRPARTEREIEPPPTTTMRGWREEMVALSLQGHGHGDDDRPEKPRRYGVTEMRSPDYSFRPAHLALQVRRLQSPVSMHLSVPVCAALHRSEFEARVVRFRRASALSSL